MVDKIPDSELSGYVLERIQRHIPEWENLEPADIKAVKLAGLSNDAYRVKIENEAKVGKIPLLLYREFKCEIVDFRIENTIFQTMSDAGFGPHCYFQCKEYRIEEFFVSKPLSIFEMRVDHFIKAYAEKICDFNNNTIAQERIAEIRPKERRFFEEMELWTTKLAQIIPEMRQVVKNEEYLSIIDKVEETFLKEGFLDKLRAWSHIDDEPVLCHCDA